MGAISQHEQTADEMYTHDKMETAEQLRLEVTCSHHISLSMCWDTFSPVPCESNITH